MAIAPRLANFSTAATALAGDDSSSTTINLILCLPFLLLNTSAATCAPSCIAVPTRANEPVKGICTPTTNSSAAAGLINALVNKPIDKSAVTAA